MRFDIYFVRDNIFDFLSYGAVTLGICIGAILIGSVIGGMLCYMQSSSLASLRRLAVGFVGVVRSVPELVLIFWLYSCLPLIMGVTFSALQTGLIALSIISGAYLSEIFRGGLHAVSKGQWEASSALGMSSVQSLRLVIFPQAIRIMMGPILNFVCDLIKTSTLLSALGIAEMSYYASSLGATTYKYLEIYTIVGVIYLIFISIISHIAKIYIRRIENENPI